jgi:hypothetical protein
MYIEFRCEARPKPGAAGLWFTVPASNAASPGDIYTVAVLDADGSYKQACDLMITRGDAQTCRHAMRAITDKAEGRRQLEYNLAAERFLMDDNSEDERALLARYVRKP